jgi:hypothetical protein
MTKISARNTVIRLMILAKLFSRSQATKNTEGKKITILG